jgi:hypothetical protein
MEAQPVHLDPALRTRAAYDLECPPSAILRSPLSNSTSIVTGCGKEAVYVEQCAACSYQAVEQSRLGGNEIGNYACQCVYTRNGEIRPRSLPIASQLLKRE